ARGAGGGVVRARIAIHDGRVDRAVAGPGGGRVAVGGRGARAVWPGAPQLERLRIQRRLREVEARLMHALLAGEVLLRVVERHDPEADPHHDDEDHPRPHQREARFAAQPPGHGIATVVLPSVNAPLASVTSTITL